MTNNDKVNGPISLSAYTSASFVFKNQNGPVMEITNEGDVLWHGKPSQGADVLNKVFQLTVDNKAEHLLEQGLRRRMYTAACENILDKAKMLSRDELIAFLEEKVQNRKSRDILSALKG